MQTSSDRERPAGIALEQVETIGSTSETLKARAAAGAGECALLARRQTGGRGRLGRPWASIDGNLHLSVLLRPGPVTAPGHWSLLAAVALAETVAQIVPAGAGLRLKWPNDLMLGDGKLAGILLEAAAEPSPWLVIGFGVNLAGAPPGLDRPLACVADVAPAPQPDAMAHRLLSCLGAWRERYAAEGFAPVRAAWLALGHHPGEPMSVGAGLHRTEGAFHGIGPDGAMLLQGADGMVTVTSGEVA